MATTIGQIQQYLNKFLEREVEININEEDRQGIILQFADPKEEGKAINVFVFLEEEGKYLKITIVDVLPGVKDSDHKFKLFEVLLHISLRTKSMQWEYNMDDGEVRAIVEFPIEDSSLTERQFIRSFDTLVRVVTKLLPGLRHILATGEDPEEKERIEAYLDLVDQILAAEEGEEVEILKQNAELIDGGLIAAMAKVSQTLFKEGNRKKGRWLSDLARKLYIALQDDGEEEEEQEEEGLSEERIKAYLGLIQELMSCESGEEADILSKNNELVDEGLIATMVRLSEISREQGDNDRAQWLRGMAEELDALQKKK